MTTYVTAGENGIEVTVGLLSRPQLDAVANADAPSATNEFVTVSALTAAVTEAGDTNAEVVLARAAGNISTAAASLSDRLALAEMDTYNVQGYGMTPAASAAANTDALNALIASNRRIVIPEGTYNVLAYDDAAPSVEGITLDNIENLHLVLHPGAILKTSPTAQGVAAYHILKIPSTANNILIEGGTFQGDRETHLLTASAHTATLTAALSGGETTISIADTTGWDTGTRNLIVLANNGDRFHAVFTVNSGTVLDLQTAVPSGFTADIGNAVYHTTGENGINVRIDGAQNVTLRDVRSIDSWTDGFYIASTSGNITLDNCTADNNRRQGLSIVGGSNIRIFGGSFNNTQGAQPQHGIDIEPSGGATITDVELHGVTCQGNERDGLRLLGVTGTNGLINGVKVFGGLFAENLQRGIYIGRTGGHLVSGATCRDNTRDGIYVFADGAGVAALDADRIEIANCRLLNNGFWGIHFDADDDASIEGCRVIGGEVGHAPDGNASGGVHLDGADGNSIVGTLISGNTNDGVLLTSAHHNTINAHVRTNELHGVELTTSHYNKIMGHIERNNRHGVVIAGGTDNEIVAKIEGNSFETNATYNGIQIASDSDRNWVHDCFIHRGDASANRQAYGVRVQGADNDNNQIINNRLYEGGVTGTHTDSGTGTTITGNIT